MNFANHIGYTDVTPYEVVRKISEKTLEIRAMRSELDPTWKPVRVPGGFAGHCVNNNTQRWIITSDVTAKVIRIRLGKRGWRGTDGGRYKLSDKPFRHYDYNF